MNIEDFRHYCLSKKGVEESFPFGPETLVYKVGGKIFALTGLDKLQFEVNLKCDPDYAIELRENNDSIIPGYHMNKKHWNTINFQSDLSNEFLIELIDHSYNLVLKSLPKKVQENLI